MKRKAEIPILYEDDHLIAVSKPPRIAVVPAEGIPLHQTLLGKIQKQFEGRGVKPYVLHRLDHQTSGIVLFGKGQADRQTLQNIFRHPETQKTYLALVQGVPHGKLITAPLRARESQETIPARTAYKILHVFKSPAPLCSLIEAVIKTGRKHQIRQHFAMIGHPVILDDRYGNRHSNRKFRLRYRLGRQFLHAAKIVFENPLLGKTIVIESPLPPDLQSVLKKLH